MSRRPGRKGDRVFACPHCGRDITPPSLTYDQAAQALGVSRSTVRRLVDEGELLVTTIRKGCRRIPRASVLHYRRKVTKEALEKVGFDKKSVSGQLMLFQES